MTSTAVHKPKDTRSQCQFCGQRTWSKDYADFMRDHDRPDTGKVCQRAAKVYAPTVRVLSRAK